MPRTRSTDGTSIAFEEHGSGRAVVLTAGALSAGATLRPLADELARRGVRAVCWDRRGRGASGDTAPYAPEREVEDLRAVVRAVGGAAAVLGHSAGAVLVLLAASSGLETSRLFLSEPVLRFGVDEPAPDLAERLGSLVDDGRPEEAVLTFQRENVRLSADQLRRLTASDDFAVMVRLARTTVYDTRLLAQASGPTPPMPPAAVGTTIMRGEPAAPIFVTGCRRLTEMVPGAELVVVRESHDHALDPVGTAREVVRRL